MGGACVTLSRVLLSILNFLLFLIGAGLICIGVFIIFSPVEFLSSVSDLQEISEVRFLIEASYIQTAAYIFIVVGVLVAILSFCGCMGSCCLSEVLLGIYIFALIQVIIIQVGLGILVILSPQWFTDALDAQLSEYKEDRTNAPNIELAINAIEIIVGCCGVNGSSDYDDIPGNRREYYVPCCVLKDGLSQNRTEAAAVRIASLKKLTDVGTQEYLDVWTKDGNTCVSMMGDPSEDVVYINTEGCIDVLASEYKTYGIIGIASVAIEIIILIIAFVVCCHARNKEDFI